MRLALVFGALTVGLGCGGGKKSGTTNGTATATDPRLELAALELRRAFARDRVLELTGPDSPVRVGAVRALARLGDEPSVAALRSLLVDGDASVRAAAARGLGVAGATDAEPDLLAAHKRFGDAPTRTSILWALGRLGTVASHDVLGKALQASPVERAEAGIALGMHGRRNITLPAALRADLIANTRHGEVAVRYGATYGLARSKPLPTDAEFALAERARGDSDESVRALAVFGLARSGARLPIEHLLADSSWRVRAQMMRSRGDATLRDDVLFALNDSLLALRGKASAADFHVVTTGMQTLLQSEKLLAVEAMSLLALARGLLSTHGSVASQAHCLAAALAVRAGNTWRELDSCGGPADAGWPMYARRQLQARLLAEGHGGDAASRLGKLLAMAKDRDARVRGVTLGAMKVLAKDPNASATLLGLAQQGLEDAAIEVAGAAVELLGALVESKVPVAGTGAANALIARARKVTEEPELRLGLLGVIAKAKLTSGRIACTIAHGDANVTVRKAGRGCIKELTGKDPGPGKPNAEMAAPPVNPKPLFGKTVTWTVVTTRGSVRIRLDPAAAPWHVAVVVSLSRRGFYDKTLWHRVVPDFVIQGGDPRGSGWGGPGYTIPGEPWGGFRRGTVGIADSGMDTGGSQWFVMHSRAPHLDGRYTIIGQVESGLDVIDAIQPGDRITSTRIEVR